MHRLPQGYRFRGNPTATYLIALFATAILEFRYKDKLVCRGFRPRIVRIMSIPVIPRHGNIQSGISGWFLTICFKCVFILIDTDIVISQGFQSTSSVFLVITTVSSASIFSSLFHSPALHSVITGIIIMHIYVPIHRACKFSCLVGSPSRYFICIFYVFQPDALPLLIMHSLIPGFVPF